MFSKLALVFLSVASAVVFVTAAPSPVLLLEDLIPLSGESKTTHAPVRGSRIAQTPGAGSCNTGPIQCCNAVYDSNSQEATLLLALLGIAVGPFENMLAASCSPITGFFALGSASSCTSNAVCCSNNSFKGFVAVGCTPVNINL